MEEAFLTFRKFHDPDLVAEMKQELEMNSIPVQIEDSQAYFDPSFAHNRLERDILLKVRPDDFLRADRVLQDLYEQLAELVDTNYYLYHFTNEELMEIVQNRDEWGYLDYALARKILKENGIAVPETALTRFQHDRKKLLAKPEQQNVLEVWLGYTLAFLMPLLGMLAGFSMWRMKKTLPDGERVFAYNAQERRHGRRIVLLSGGFLIFWLWAYI